MNEELKIKWKAVVAKAETDANYKQRLLDNTLQVLIDEGWDVSNWSRAEVRLNGEGVLSLWTADELGNSLLKDDDLDEMNGGRIRMWWPQTIISSD